MSSEAETI